MTDRRPKKRQAELPVKKIATLLALLAGGLLALSYLLPALFGGDSKSSAPSPPKPQRCPSRLGWRSADHRWQQHQPERQPEFGQ